MKSIIYSLSFIIVTLYPCQGQEKSNRNPIVKIQAIKDSIKCRNHKDKFVFNFPDILGKNENNFFNNIIIKDYLSYLDIENKLITPKKLIQVAVNKKKQKCNNDNFSGFASSDYIITYHSDKILSINMNR